jgi:uncharacterized Zn finger protein (UPF0148 family)
MTERMNCSNCGAPVTRTGNEARVACPHCQTVTEFASHRHVSEPPDSDEDLDDVDSSRHRHVGSGEAIPQIVIIQGGGGTTIVRRTSYLPFLIGPILFIAISAGISFMHMRAARTAASQVAGAEKAVEKAEKTAEKAEKAAEKKPGGHH